MPSINLRLVKLGAFAGMPLPWALQLYVDNKMPHSPPPFEDALQEALQVGLDLSREEREFHQVSQGLVLLFHS